LRSNIRSVRVDEPLVSVIMPVRNREWCVRRAIDSVLAQTCANVELIVVDDGSSDRSAAIAESYGPRLRLLRQDQAGAYAARNLGMRHARGELIAFADSDDAWMPGKLAAQVPLMRRSEVGLVFGDTIHVREAIDDAEPNGSRSFQLSPPRRGQVSGPLVWRNFVPTSTVLVRRSCLEEIGGFCTTGPRSADYLAWFRIALRHEFDFVEAPVCIYTVHAHGLSFDLGPSLATRIALFSAELKRTRDPAARAKLRRLLFNLSLHLGLAVARRRTRKVPNALRLARRTAWQAAGLQGPGWTAQFLVHQLWLRTRRLV
jgi:glycosyltransferase involved in cell wall biosynthesis